MYFLKRIGRIRARLASPSPRIATPSQCPSRATTVELPDKVLLDIFCYFVDDSPRHWPTLVHICRKWRRIVFASQRTLHLRLFCTHGTPVQKSLDYWPAALPIVVEYGGSPGLDAPAPEEECDIIAALKQSHRVHSISLTVTSSLRERLFAISGSFSELEDLVLLSRESERLVLPYSFRWGPRLRRLHSTRVTVLPLLRALELSNDLVDLQLHEVLDPWHLSPGALTNALSRTVQLRSLSLRFISTPTYFPLPTPSGERVLLPFLTRFHFQGTTEYLEKLSAGIEAPRLGDIEVTFFDKPISDLSNLAEFINRTGMHKPHHRAHIQFSERAVSISLTRPGATTCFKFQLFGEQLALQLSFISRICISFSPYLFNMDDLRISTTRQSRWEDGVDSTKRWRELIDSFTGIKWFHVSGNLSESIVRALLVPDNRRNPVLPALHKLCIPQPEPRLTPLCEDVVSFMISRQLSGHPIAVEYERPRHTSELRERVGLFSQQVTIEMLSEDVVLKIFRRYLDDAPHLWPTLGCVCKRWRNIVLASHLGLNLRLYFTHKAPVVDTLDCWPDLPIAVQYGGFPNLDAPALEDNGNIISALKQSGRVSSIRLTVTSELTEKLSAISEPFSELEELALLSEDNIPLALPRTFRWGSRLRTLHLTGIAFPSFPPLLSTCHDLVDLQLHDIPNAGYFSPEAFANALTGLAQLRSLSLHFFSYPPLPNETDLPQPGDLVVLPALTCFRYRGTCEYLDILVARIDAPCLADINITLFDTPSDLSKLCGFIDRMEMHKPHHRAHILLSERTTSISLVQPAVSINLKVQSFRKELNERLDIMAQICTRFSAFLFLVDDLRISLTRKSRWDDLLHTKQWSEVLDSFISVKWFHIAGDLSIGILRTLDLPSRRRETVLPALQKLDISQPLPRHAPLTEATVPLMTSRQLSGHPIAVEYQQLRKMGERSGAGLFSPQVTIEMLFDDILLNIFRHCLDATPRCWSTLGFVCRRWRQKVLTSPLGQNLQLRCTHGTPVLKALNCWPTLPIAVQYGGSSDLSPPAREDDDNIISALKQSGRVSSISLTATSSIVEKLSAISEPFSELEKLTLLSQNTTELILPSTFRWGNRLHTLRSTRIAFPSLLPLLSPCHDIVDLQLHEIPIAGYFSPESFANSLSGLAQLRSLSLHFLSFPHRRSYLSLPPPSRERVVLPALTNLKYRGTSKYLDSLVARIDAPYLGDIDITFFYQPTIDASQIGRFIERLDTQMPLSRADVETSAQAISICFTSTETSTRLRLQISCKRLDWQLSCMAQVCDQIPRFLFRVEDLAISTTESSSGKDDLGSEQWLDLVCSFASATDFRMAGELTADVLRVLGPADGDDIADMTVLPSLRVLRVHNPLRITGPFWHAAQSIITSRRRSGRPLELQFVCHGCNTSYTSRRTFKTHLVDEHAYRLMCSYCGDFECNPRLRHRFREHLANEHTEVARNDELISGPIIYSSELQRLVNRHSSLCAPDIVAPDTTGSAPHFE